MQACVWHDTKRLTMLFIPTCFRRCIRTKHTESGYWKINRPLCVDDYNLFIGGVNTADQRMKTYLFPHRSRKWYNRIFNAILSVSVVNAKIIYWHSPWKSLCWMSSLLYRKASPVKRATKAESRPHWVTCHKDSLSATLSAKLMVTQIV